MKNPSIMISLPVTNLQKSVVFYEAIGFVQNNQFPGGDRAAHLTLSDAISVVLLTHSLWQEFTTREIPDAKKVAQVGFILSRESKQAVDEMIENGQNAGGKPDPNPVEEFEFMYGRSLEDPDGHIWEAKWMNMPCG